MPEPGLKSVPFSQLDKPIASASEVMAALQEAIRTLCETHSVEALTIIGVLHTMAAFQRGQTCQQWQREAEELQTQQYLAQLALMGQPAEGGMQ